MYFLVKNFNLIFITFSLIFFTACSHKPHKESFKKDFPPMGVEVIKVTTKKFPKIIETIGELQSPDSVIITSDIEGKIIYLNIPEGKEVPKGHVLAKVEEDTNLAELKIAEAKLNRAEEYFKRIQNLNLEGAVSDQKLEDALEELRIAEGELDHVKANKIKTIITTPFQGTLSLKKISIGSYIKAGDEIVRISRINPMHLVFSLPEKYISEVMLGQNVVFSCDDKNKNYTANIIAIDPYIDTDNRTIKIKAKVLNNKKELFPGQFASVKHTIELINNAIVIPNEALIQEGNTKKVYLVSKDNLVSQSLVSVEDYTDTSAHISSGLMVGDSIVISGHQKVFPGSKVIPKEIGE